MCRYFLAAALLAALTGSAFAQDRYWYVGGDFGAVIVEDIDFGIGGVTEEIDLNHDYGFDGSAFIGYDFGAFRIEAEVAYKAADLEHLTFAPFPEEPAGGSTNVFSFMANGVLDINALLNVGNYNGPSFFIGGGPGVARINFDDLHSVAFPAVNFDGDDTTFAWQLIAGLRQPITNSIDITLRYRFFDVPGVQIPTFAGTGRRNLQKPQHSGWDNIQFWRATTTATTAAVTTGPCLPKSDWSSSARMTNAR